MRSILVATDLSTESENALVYAKRLALAFDANVTLLHVLEEVDPPHGLNLSRWQLRNQAEVRAQVRRRIKVFSDEVILRVGPPVEFDFRIGRPAEEILRVARERNVDLIVVAAHGHSTLARLIIGSTAEKVVRCATCPVLVVRELPLP